MKKYTEHHIQYDEVFRFLTQPETDQEIIELQDILLTNGIHSFITSDNVATRSVISTFLLALNHYQSIGHISIDMIPVGLNVPATNLYSEFKCCLHNSDLLYEILLDDFMYDFLWIEYNPVLLPLIETLLDLNMHREIPILVVQDLEEEQEDR